MAAYTKSKQSKLPDYPQLSHEAREWSRYAHLLYASGSQLLPVDWMLIVKDPSILDRPGVV